MLGKLLCLLGLHKWGKVKKTFIPHQEHSDWDEVMAKRCERCNAMKVVSYGHQ